MAAEVIAVGGALAGWGEDGGEGDGIDDGIGHFDLPDVVAVEGVGGDDAEGRGGVFDDGPEGLGREGPAAVAAGSVGGTYGIASLVVEEEDLCKILISLAE